MIALREATSGRPSVMPTFRAALIACGLSLAALGCLAQEAPPKLTVPDIRFCTDPRPQMCPEVYMPVCGFTKDGVAHTYSNSCHACVRPEVVRYAPGACKTGSLPG
jgi:hypothetical protein